MNTTPKLLIAALALLLPLAPACGEDKDEAGDDTTTTTEEAAEESEGDDESAVPLPAGCEEEAPTGAAAVVEERGEPEVEPVEGEVTEMGTEDIEVGDGAEVVAEGAVEIHYVLAKGDGEVVESTWETGSPQEVPLAQAGPEFTQAVTGMKEGGRRRVEVPASQLFAGSYPPGVTEADTMVLMVDLVSVSAEATAGAEATADPAALAAVTERGAPEVTVPDPLPEELTIIDDVEGTGAVVCPGATVLAHYTGIDASSGEQFDSSWEGGEPISFPLDGVIEGWGEGLVGMKVGGRRTLVIPGEQAYGESDEDSAGQPTGDLVFTVDLVGVG